MKKLLFFISICFCLFSSPEGVIKVFVTKNEYDYSTPWNSPTQFSVQGSGCMIEGNRILTNAHVADQAAFIEVSKAGDFKRYPAFIEGIDHYNDLALLRVIDPAFFENTYPLMIGERPHLGERVIAYGFQRGGDQITVTEGVVSRFDFAISAHSNVAMMVYQIDAAINPGSSGGPVMKGDELVGIAFQGRSDVNGIGYVIPVETIHHFLEQIENHLPLTFHQFGFCLQPGRNPSLREYLQIPNEVSGVFVSSIDQESLASEHLKENDFLTHVDGVPVGDDGTILLRGVERIKMSYLKHLKSVGDSISFTLYREGKKRKVTFHLDGRNPFLVPRISPFPSYFCIGGLVFQKLCFPYFEFMRKQNLDYSRLYETGLPSRDKKEVVILSHVLAHPLTAGYEECCDWVIEEVNGEEIYSLSHLIEVFEKIEEPFVRIVNAEGQKIILKRELIKRYNEEILKSYHIPFDRSLDMRESREE